MEDPAPPPWTSSTLESRLADLAPPGFRLACALLHDPSAAEDAVQEAALKAWRKADRLRPGSDPLPWFLGIVANECRSTLRGRWWTLRASGAVIAEVVRGPEDEVLRGADLRREIRRLPERDRLVVVLFFYLDLTLEQVAEASGLSVSATRSRLYRSIRRLRPGLDPKEAMS